MSEPVYVDTSAFIKRYLNEDRTSDMEAFAMDSKDRMAISSLTVTEFRSVLKRRLRMGTIGNDFLGKATQQLLKEIAGGTLRFHAIDAATFNLAGDLIERLELAGPRRIVVARRSGFYGAGWLGQQSSNGSRNDPPAGAKSNRCGQSRRSSGLVLIPYHAEIMNAWKNLTGVPIPESTRIASTSSGERTVRTSRSCCGTASNDSLVAPITL